MTPRRRKPPRYTLTFGLDIPADLEALAAADPMALDAAQTTFDDIACGRVVGKLLGSRNVGGDLTGLAG